MSKNLPRNIFSIENSFRTGFEWLNWAHLHMMRRSWLLKNSLLLRFQNSQWSIYFVFLWIFSAGVSLEKWIFVWFLYQLRLGCWSNWTSNKCFPFFLILNKLKQKNSKYFTILNIARAEKKIFVEFRMATAIGNRGVDGWVWAREKVSAI